MTSKWLSLATTPILGQAPGDTILEKSEFAEAICQAKMTNNVGVIRGSKYKLIANIGINARVHKISILVVATLKSDLASC